MPNNRVGRVLEQLRHVADLTDAQTSDKQLLAAFLSRHDETAFAVLVRRYGPMIHGVCRRVLRNDADAEDAFQATFLVLVRRAEQAGRRSSLANWLYGVAYRTALHARSANARRCRLEAQVRPMARNESPTDAAMYSELQQLLDQELNALPEKYRAVVVLCDLLGTTKREAAQQLRCPEGTVSSRLARGRELLRKRLTRHGAALSLAALAAFLEQNKAPASAPLIDTTVKTAALVAAGNVIAATGLAPNAAVLMERVLKSMLLTKLKIATGLLLVFAVLGATTTLIACRSMGNPQPTPQPATPERAADEKVAQVKEAKEAVPNKERFTYDGKNFAHWRDLLKNDLKPAARIEALKALGAFGANGYADEVTVAILDVMSTYDPARDNLEAEPVPQPVQVQIVQPGFNQFGAQNVPAPTYPALGMGTKFVQTAQNTLVQMGVDALPSLAKGWEHGALKQRRFVAETLEQIVEAAAPVIPSNFGGGQPLPEPPPLPPPYPPEVVPLLLRVLKDKDPLVRTLAAKVLHRAIQLPIWNDNVKIVPDNRKALRTALTKAFQSDTDAPTRLEALAGLLDLVELRNDPQTRALIVAAALNEADPDVRRFAVNVLAGAGSGGLWNEWSAALGIALGKPGAMVASQETSSLLKTELLPAMLWILEKEDVPEIRSSAVSFFGQLCSSDKDAIKALLSALKRARSSDERIQIITYVGALGSAGKKAVPALRELLDGKTKDDNPKVREAATKALQQIQPKP